MGISTELEIWPLSQVIRNANVDFKDPCTMDFRDDSFKLQTLHSVMELYKVSPTSLFIHGAAIREDCDLTDTICKMMALDCLSLQMNVIHIATCYSVAKENVLNTNM